MSTHGPPFNEGNRVAFCSAREERREYIRDAHGRNEGVRVSALVAPLRAAEKERVQSDDTRAQDEDEKRGEPIGVG